MTPLLDAPSTITTAQLSYLHRLARDHGMDTAALHEAAGVDSLKRLSVAGASALIARLGGGDLPAPGPGRRPPRKRRSPNVIAMITVGQVEQIERLGVHFFNGDRGQFDSWLEKNFKVKQARDLATVERAGQIIAVLKGMLGQPLNTATGIRK